MHLLGCERWLRGREGGRRGEGGVEGEREGGWSGLVRYDVWAAATHMVASRLAPLVMW